SFVTGSSFGIIDFQKTEVKNMELGAVFNRCVECDDIITNPICPHCLAKKMRLVVGEVNPKLAEKITGVDIDGETNCLFCHKPMGLCAHCFSKDVYEMLVANNYTEDKDFMAKFDFFLRKEWSDFN
ncbi:MAG: hypothetical protein Q7J06_10765, partial [Bacteroidales bacterium]|nr:hypothetical protein [Bacteroidales bacterium]